MSDDTLIAYERALGLVGSEVWAKLSDHLRRKILDAELAALVSERTGIATLADVATAQKEAGQSRPA